MKKKKLFTIIYMKSFINLIIVSIYEIMKINKKIKMEKKIIGTQEQVSIKAIPTQCPFPVANESKLH